MRVRFRVEAEVPAWQQKFLPGSKCVMVAEGLRRAGK